MDPVERLEGQLRDYHQRCCEDQRIAKDNAKAVAHALAAIETARSDSFSNEERDKAIGLIAYYGEESGFWQYLDSLDESVNKQEDT